MTDPFDSALVDVLCNGPWRVEPMAVRLARADGRLLPTAADRRLAAAFVDAYPAGAEPDELTAFLQAPAFTRWWATAARDHPARPVDRGEREPGPLAHLHDVATLAALLDVTPDELDHLARVHRPDADTGPPRARHYRYLVRPRRGGGVRVIEVPKQRLKQVQRRVLRQILDPLPVHPATFGTTPRRGVVAAAGRHSAADVVVCLDLAQFFTTVTAARVAGWFAAQGAEPAVARLLARLVTNGVPRDVRDALPRLPGPDGIDRTWWRDRTLAARHLPQGAPTSPAIADRLLLSLDRRLTGLADRLDATYTRYVDDLTFSGSQALPVGALLAAAESIVRAEGFRLAADKTRVQRSSGRQRVLGAVVNAHPTLARRDSRAATATPSRPPSTTAGSTAGARSCATNPPRVSATGSPAGWRGWPRSTPSAGGDCSPSSPPSTGADRPQSTAARNASARCANTPAGSARNSASELSMNRCCSPG